ncbi:uncharacterized protein BJ212DRAFT_1485665 [Suillus subaureus]|uniref:HAT C-terminal dimerisation domain-containing protein n=1 Tax=Suillus subaureus TaxID=48587 RepID=A0A9P7E050_9AGAM|nr:uncharacterized protein BJ212DRAFT_1485665 [Suillus subaureus]KAG1807253.1 hypothetical protein BJ212DRAFT_1485665 [Suillus subaureus]
MASSVSSECAFSQGGITISKCHNHLKGDIVEALQCVKCALHHDLLFHEPGPSSSTEGALEDSDIEMDANEKLSDVEDGDEEGWDALLEGDEDFIESDADSMITWAAAQAKAKPKPAVTGGFGLAWNFCKPKLSEARPKLWLLSQAGPEHHYLL